MKKHKLKETFDKIMESWKNMSSLVCYTEAVLITNPSPIEIVKGFYRNVDRKDYEGFRPKEVLNDTFGDMLNGKKSRKEERLYRNFWM